MCVAYIFPLNFYRLTVLLLSESYQRAPRQSLVTLLWRGGKPTVCRQVCYQRPHNGGLGIPNLKSHWLAERLAFLGRSLMEETVWKRKIEVAFPNLASNPVTKSCCRPKGEAVFFAECRKYFG